MQSSSPTSPTPNAATLVWEQLSERLDAFISAWDGAAEPPRLGEFLPDEPPDLRRLTLVEAIKVDLEYRWQELRWPKRVEEYLAEFPELSVAGSIPCDLIYEEYHIRRQFDREVSSAEYFERFPQQVAELRRLLNLESPELTTTLVRTEKMEPIVVGDQLDDFDLLSSLGKGAFATVFLARQRSMQRLVALKVSKDRGFEHQTLAQLDHPNIVRVFDTRQIAERKLRLLYMQYVPGGTLQSVIEHARAQPPAARSGATLLESIDYCLERKGEQPPSDSMTRWRLGRASWPEVVCWIGSRLASALAYAHGRGVLHRDVKPANVLVGADGSPRLADFNISFSKLDGATPAAYFGGSLAYMSPEQLEACDPAHARQPEDLDGRSDVYSLAVLLWEMLTARRPFDDDSPCANWAQALASMTAARRAGVGEAARLQAPHDCPPGLVDVLLKALSPEVDDRHASAADLGRDLDLCLQPRARALLDVRRGWRWLPKRYPVASTILMGLIPNVVMCVLNIKYNVEHIVKFLSPVEIRVFTWQIVIINSLSYSLALGYIFTTRRELFSTLRRLARGEKLPAAPDAKVLRRCLTFGDAAALITVALWSISGFVFPAWMQLGTGENSLLRPEHYTHFIVSNLLCGLIAATQTFFHVTRMAVRHELPWLVRAGGSDARQMSDLAALARRSRLWLGLTVAVPFLAVLAVVLIDFQRFVIGALGAIGLVGCAWAWFLDQTIRTDLASLAAAMNPGDPLAGGDSLDSFLTSSRR